MQQSAMQRRLECGVLEVQATLLQSEPMHTQVHNSCNRTCIGLVFLLCIQTFLFNLKIQLVFVRACVSCIQTKLLTEFPIPIPWKEKNQLSAKVISLEQKVNELNLKLTPALSDTERLLQVLGEAGGKDDGKLVYPKTLGCWQKCRQANKSIIHLITMNNKLDFRI